MKLPFFRKPAMAGAAGGARSAAPLRRAPDRSIPLVLLLPFLLLAAFVGMVGGLDSPALVAIIGAAVLSVLLLFVLPLYGMFLCLFVLTFLIQGSALYFAGFKAATWLAFGLAILFFFRALLDLVTKRQRGVRTMPGDGSSVPVAAVLFIVCFAVSIVFNRIPKAQMASAIKSTLPMFSVLFALYWFAWKEAQLERIWKLFSIVVLLQVPVVLYQHFVVASATTFDAIVGTFGGTPGAGGNSAVMVFFTVLTMGYAAARWQAGLLSRRAMLGMMFVGLAIIMLGEVKAAFIWLPLVLGWVLRKRILKSVFAFIGFGLLVGVFVGTTYIVYDALYWGKKVDSGRSVADKLDKGGGYFFDPNNVNYRTGEISRGASIAIWAHDPQETMPRRLVGYGPGSIKPAGLMGAGEVALRYAPLHLDATALAILLWDLGVLGAAAYGSMLLFGLLAAWRYVRQGRGTPAQRAIADTCVAAMLLFLMMLIYSRAVMDEPTAQLLLMLCLGTVVQLCRFTESKKAAAKRLTPVARMA
ncbi:hypothetical protein AB4Z19_25075 [Pseudoduganella sp. RAF19]|uniref:hypothetical protein n=1 Tax=Pseudoduganella sp. RAF19 TaxID=3233052 RepID=UPI003F9D7D10